MLLRGAHLRQGAAGHLEDRVITEAARAASLPGDLPLQNTLDDQLITVGCHKCDCGSEPGATLGAIGQLGKQRALFNVQSRSSHNHPGQQGKL